MRFCILLVAILAITFIYVSCNKHTIQKSTGDINKVVSGWAHSSNSGLRTELSFDQARNIVKEETDNDISTYQFVNDSIIIREFDKEENRCVYQFAGKIDSQKRLVRGIATSSYITTAPDTVHHFFEYNKEGYLLTETRRSSSSDTFLVRYEYEDIVMKKVTTFSNSTVYNTKEFTYYDNELSYSLPEETKFRKNLNNLVGHSNQKLVKKIVSTGKNGKEKYISNYEYQMDANGYASRMISRKGKKIGGVVTFYYGETVDPLNKAVAANNN